MIEELKEMRVGCKPLWSIAVTEGSGVHDLHHEQWY